MRRADFVAPPTGPPRHPPHPARRRGTPPSQKPEAPAVRILFATSEAEPFAKTGGLADVSRSLPQAIAALGHDVRVVMPLYKSIDMETAALHPILAEIDVHFPDYTRRGYVQRSTFPGSDVPVYFIQQDHYFGRDTFYGPPGRDYPDNPERFGFFSLAALWMLKGLDWQPDVIHCNDWPAALIPTYLRHHPHVSVDPFFKSVSTLYTIHNLAYQCIAPANWVQRLGLPTTLFTPAGLEFWGKLNLMKAGIQYADHLSTVSRQYAHEIRTPEFGCGLEGVLEDRATHLTGILNGVDYAVWNPQTDSLIPARYSAADLRGKEKCKAALQTRLGLPEKPGTPMVGMITRLVDQKGLDLLADVFTDLMKLDIQLAILGTGDDKYHTFLTRAAEKYPGRVGVRLAFDDELAHWIEAGSDMFLMPSRYEPSGLNQLYSLRYGTIPIVRRTGGLADSIANATPSTIKSGAGTGFLFEEYNGKRMFDAVVRAVKLYKANPRAWAHLVQNAMAKDYSWNASAREYQKLYKKMAG